MLLSHGQIILRTPLLDQGLCNEKFRKAPPGANCEHESIEPELLYQFRAHRRAKPADHWLRLSQPKKAVGASRHWIQPSPGVLPKARPRTQREASRCRWRLPARITGLDPGHRNPLPIACLASPQLDSPASAQDARSTKQGERSYRGDSAPRPARRQRQHQRTGLGSQQPHPALTRAPPTDVVIRAGPLARRAFRGPGRSVEIEPFLEPFGGLQIGPL